MRPDLIIFDCDGVLVDSEILSCRCLSELLKVHGTDLSVEDVMQLFLGRSRSAVIEHFGALGSPLPRAFPEQLQSRVHEIFRAELRLVEGVSDLIESLQIPFCVASSSDPSRLALSLSLTGLEAHFADRWFSAESVKSGKPAPDLFLYAAAAMKARPGNVLVIEDSVNGILAGKAAGMTVWGFVGASHQHLLDGTSALEAAGADRIIRSMSEMGQAIRGLEA